MNRTTPLTLTLEDRRRLEAIVADPTTPQKHVWRCRIVLATADGFGTMAIARSTGKSKECVRRWRNRYAEEGVDGLLRDKTRPPGKPRTPLQTEADLVALALTKPKHAATHWTVRELAREFGLAPSTVHRILNGHGIRPHRWETFKLSTDPHFVEKLRDVVDLYVNPPPNCVVFGLDEKTQIQALDHTQPGLPLKKGRGQTRTHDYRRNGTTSLFSALNVLTGAVIGDTMKRHRHQELIRFLNKVDRFVPPHLDIHVILDNYGTHKCPQTRKWLKRHPRWTFHFIPTSCSWLNAVEGFFAKLSRRRLKHGVFKSVQELDEAIERFIEEHNEHDAKPFVWRADPDEIIAARKRGFQKLGIAA